MLKYANDLDNSVKNGRAAISTRFSAEVLHTLKKKKKKFHVYVYIFPLKMWESVVFLLTGDVKARTLFNIQ